MVVNCVCMLENSHSNASLNVRQLKVVLQALDLSALSSMMWWNFYQRNAEGILSLTWRKSRCEGWKLFDFLFLYKISFYDRSDFILVWPRNQITIASKASPSYKKRENKFDIKNTSDNMTFWKQEAIFSPFLLKEKTIVSMFKELKSFRISTFICFLLSQS